MHKSTSLRDGSGHFNLKSDLLADPAQVPLGDAQVRSKVMKRDLLQYKSPAGSSKALRNGAGIDALQLKTAELDELLLGCDLRNCIQAGRPGDRHHFTDHQQLAGLRACRSSRLPWPVMKEE